MFLFLEDSVSLYNPGCPETYSVDWAGLKLTEIHLPLPLLGLKACATTAQRLDLFLTSSYNLNYPFLLNYVLPRDSHLLTLSPTLHASSASPQDPALLPSVLCAWRSCLVTGHSGFSLFVYCCCLLFVFVFGFGFWFFETGFLCSFGACPELALVDQAGLEFTEICLPLPLLGLKACATTARPPVKI